MKKHLFLIAVGIILLGFAGIAWAQCPEEPFDSGICDTLYVEVYEPGLGGSPPWEVNVTVLVTHDLPTWEDSLGGFLVPLEITHTNPTAYCSIPEWMNNTAYYPSPFTDHSIFRHFGGMENRMMKMSERQDGSEWGSLRNINHYSGGAQFLMWVQASEPWDQRWWEGSRTLLFTMSLLVEDTMTICIDTCFWPPADHLCFGRYDAVLYAPRHFMPYCFTLSYPAVGDVTADGTVDVADVIFLVSYVFINGMPPYPLEIGDVDCDGLVNIGDVMYLINYLFLSGSLPCG
jgi:hypothetical protein